MLGWKKKRTICHLTKPFYHSFLKEHSHADEVPRARLLTSGPIIHLKNEPDARRAHCSRFITPRGKWERRWSVCTALLVHEKRPDAEIQCSLNWVASSSSWVSEGRCNVCLKAVIQNQRPLSLQLFISLWISELALRRSHGSECLPFSNKC